ncbi:MAG: cyclic nucleotide-binding domain-containing protein [Chloroflexi bacterium]|nr:cyclic nucleotide-binding domain-containing protein [Chloroflexota bacterium]
MDPQTVLAQVPIFSHLSKGDLKRLARISVPRTFKAGEQIIKEGDTAAGVFIVMTGKVEVVKGSQRLAVFDAGEFFGEMALFESYPRSATVRALEDTECIALSRWDFSAELKSQPEIAVGMLAHLVRRLRETTDARVSD